MRTMHKIASSLFLLAAVCGATEPSLRHRELHHTKHQCNVYFEPVYYLDSDARLTDFDCVVLHHTITNSQPFEFDGCSLTSDGLAAVNIKAGHKNSNGPANVFAMGLDDNQMIGADLTLTSTKRPAQLHFTVTLDLTFTYEDGTVVNANDIRVGQGFTRNILGIPEDNWWLGGSNLSYGTGDMAYLGMTYDFDHIMAGAKEDTVMFGWEFDESGDKDDTFQIALCKGCTSEVLNKAAVKAKDEVDVNKWTKMWILIVREMLIALSHAE